MPVVVDSTRLQRRLSKLIRELPRIAAASVVAGAISMRTEIQKAVRTNWVRNNQVGFDISNFLSIIQEVESIPGGGVGILNVEKMGTGTDFEKIAHVRGLYHQKTRQGDKFGLFINQMGMFFNQVSELEQGRSDRWGRTEPQWWLIEHGTLGVPGAWSPRPPTNTISTTAIVAAPLVWREVETTVDRMFRDRGIIS